MNAKRNSISRFLSLLVVLSVLIPATLLAPVPISQAAATDWLSPSANQVYPGGDNNGFQDNPTYAYANDSNYASNPDGAGDRHGYFNYNISLPPGAVVTGIEVRLDGWRDNTSGQSAGLYLVELSDNGGDSWPSDDRWTGALGTSDPEGTLWVGGPTDMWGLNDWTASELSNGNFRVRITSSSYWGNRDFFLDWVAVRITYNVAPTLSYSAQTGYEDGLEPNTGDPGDTFTYKVVYTDADNDAPSYVRVYIDSTTAFQTMSRDASASGALYDGNYANGEQYIYSTTLAGGNHTYYFAARDSGGATARLPGSGNLSGPNVSAPPPAPTVPDPPDGALVTNGTLTLRWNAVTDPNDDPVTYLVSIDGSAFVDVGGATQYAPGTPFNNGTTYTWQVRACDPGPLCSTSATWSFTVDTSIIGPNQDAYIDQSTSRPPYPADTNYGDNQYLYVRSDTSYGGAPANRRAFLRFDLPAITTCYPGTSPSIVQAGLRLYAAPGPSILRTYQVYRVNAAWNETNPNGITWNNQPNVAPNPTASINVPINFTGWVEWDVTPDLQNFIDYGGANTNYGWVIKDSDETQVSGMYETRFRAREYGGSDATYDPRLVIVYNCPPAAPALVAPANGAFLADNTPLLDWDPATDPNVGDTLSYAVRVSTSGIWGSWITSPGTATQYQVTTPVLSEGYHEWQVRVSDGRAEALSDIWGFTVDTDTPATPTYLYEGIPDQDYYPDTDYSLLINWGSVPDTGSGISYRLERRVTAGGPAGPWTLVITTTNTSFLDTGTFANNDLIEYQVRAHTGAGTDGGWQTSDGVRVDAQAVPQVTGVGEGITAGINLDWIRNNVYSVYWDVVASTGSPISYEVERSVDGGPWELLPPATPTCDALHCWRDDPAVHPNGANVHYHVRVVNGAGSQGAWSADSDGITIDSSAPDSSVTTGGLFGPGTWPGSIIGVASDAGSGVARVDIRIYDTNTYEYWNGTAWGPAATWVQADGTTAWSYPFPVGLPRLTDGHSYVVESRATDVAGNVETVFGTNNFTYSGSLPAAPALTSPTHPDPATWYNDNHPTFQWNVPSGGVVDNYSYILDQVDGAIPDTTPEGNVTSYDAGNRADGVWYFHIRAHNAAGWGPAGQVRVNIDTTAPLAPASVSEESPDVDWHAGGSVTVYWAAVSDTSPVTYSLERCVNGGLSGTCTSSWAPVAADIAATQYDDSIGAANGTTVRYRVRATDSVPLSSTNWRESDGLTIDSLAPGTPAGVFEDATGEPDRDWHSSANGAVTVHWATVTKTGSPITYRLEKELNNSGIWTLVASDLTVTAYADSGLYGDGDKITYRVIAVNGVRREGAPGVSDGFVIDTLIPARPEWVREGVATYPDWAYSDGSAFSVFWSGVPDTGSHITYSLERCVDGGSSGTCANSLDWEPVADGLSGTSYLDAASYADGTTIRYRVMPINGAETAGPNRLSNGITIDRDTPDAPGWVTESSPDVDYDDDGAVRVYWEAVANTGSGITYELQRRVTPPGGPTGSWVQIANNYLTTNYNVTTTYPDETFIEYQVIAHNVGHFSTPPTASDGVRVDRGTPDTPTNVGEGDVAGTDDDYDQDNTFFVYWTGVVPTASGDQIYYTVERNVNGGGWVTAGSRLPCGGAPCQWDDPAPFSNGDRVQYQVTAVNGAGRAGTPSLESNGITIDTLQPDSTVTTNGFFTNFTWPGAVVGTSSDLGSGVAYVDIQVQQRNGPYWNGTAWVGTLTWLPVDGSDNWRYALDLDALTDGATYDVRSRATDNAGNVETTLGASSFTYSGSGPDVPVISSPTHPVETNWYNNNAPRFDWTTPSGGGGLPVSGYSYILDQNASTLPDTSVDTQGNTVSYSGLADGTWYFHVRAVNSANNWGPAAHFRINIDRDTPAAPTSITEESPDVQWDADGSVTVYWSAVTDTGSGITYRLEQQVNGGSWTLVISTTSTSRLVSGLGDGQTALFRVRATNGVPLSSDWTTSNGVTIDMSTPGTPAGVGEGDAAGTDDDWDQDNTFFVYWTAVTGAPSGITYSVERSRNSGAWEQIATGLACGGTPCRWEDTNAYATGESVAYRVTAVNGARRSGPASTPSDGLTLDFVVPDSAVTTNGFYNNTTWPGYVEGTASDTGSDVAIVDIQVQRRSDSQYWSGTGWDAALTWLPVSGTHNWQYALGVVASLTDGATYDVRSRATDNAGNVEVTLGASSFTYSGSGPGVPTISSPTHSVETNWYNNNAPRFDWTTPSGGGGLQVTGYSYILDQNTSTMPDNSVDTQGNTVSYSGVADGTWYLHVRAVNSANNWGPAAHFRINIDITAPPAPATVTEESPDVAWDSDGTVTVYWGAVSDLSGVTYTLQRNLNGAGWTDVAAGIATTSYTVSGFANGASVVFQVRATNGAGLNGSWTQSNGVSFDTTTPSTPAGVGEGDIVGIDDDWDQDNTFFVYWTAVTGAPSGITYSVERNRNNSGVWDLMVAGLTTTQWDDPTAYSNGESVAYRVTARTGAGRSGPASLPSDGLTLDFVQPDSTINTSGFYNSFTWPGFIPGIASDDRSDVHYVDITIRRQSGSLYWDGTAWGAAVVWLRATGAANWQYTFAPADGQTYNVQSRATDNADNVETTFGTSTFNYSASGPGAPVISSPTHPTQTVWFNNNTPTFNWTTPASGSSIQGYSYILDQTPDTEPDLAADTSGNTRHYDYVVVDGTWYFHVRALDRAGNWGPPSHFRVNIDTTNPPAPALITEGSPDVDWDADGNITVYWSPVTDLSGVTYTLERSTNGGGTWAGVGSGITTTSYLDPVTHPDAVTILYRVHAVDAVNLPGPDTQSDGVTIDSETPAQPAGVGEGDVVGTDDTWDQDNTFFAFWNTVPDTGSGIVYTIERNINDGAWQVVQTNYAQTFWEDPQIYTDTATIRYRITAINRVGSVGPASAASSGITLDLSQPNSVIGTAGPYGLLTWPSSITGTATDSTSGVGVVHITLQRSFDGAYWNGATWGGMPVWLLTTGTTTWAYYSFEPTDGESYNVQSRATDAAGNVEVTLGVSAFSYSTNEPNSAVSTNGLYVGAGWSGQITGMAYAPKAPLDYVDVTIQRASDGLYFTGAAWVSTTTWLRATGANPWAINFTPADGETYAVQSRATDKANNVEASYGANTFSYDAAAPVIETVTVTSDKTYLYNPGLTADGGSVYFNSRAGEGAGQALTVAVTFSEPHPYRMSGAPAFGDAPPADTAAPWTAQYSVEANAGTQPGVVFTVSDTLGLTDMATVNFVQDNIAPDSAANVAANATNVSPIVIDWQASDSGSGVHQTNLWVKYQPLGTWTNTGLVMSGQSGSFAYTPTSGSGTYYFATVAVDNVGNVESAPTGFGDDAVDFDNIPSSSTVDAPTYAITSPIMITWTAAADAKYTYLFYRYGATGVFTQANAPFSTLKSGAFTFEPTHGDGHYYFATVAIDDAGNVEPIALDGKALTIYDTRPPTSTATSPAEWGGFDFTVEWIGDDTAIGSGIAYYDVQVKVGNGEWTDWITRTAAVSATYTAVYVGQPDAIYHFRTRATDKAGHIEAWPAAENGDTTTLVHFPGHFPGKYKLFLPLVARNQSGTQLPDLTVTAITVTPPNPVAGQPVDLAVTIKNQGTLATSGCFWTDLYINPIRRPIYNDTWDQISSEGLTWYVCNVGIGESITLRINDSHFRPDYSRFYGTFAAPITYTLYAQVDNWNSATSYGGVYESNEQNNVYGPQVVPVSGAAVTGASLENKLLLLPMRPDPTQP